MACPQARTDFPTHTIMTDSLRDQLLGLGFKPAPKPERKPESRTERRPERRPDPRQGARRAEGRPDGKPGTRSGQGARPPGNSAPRPAQQKPAQPRPARSREEMDLAKAYAIRAQKEKEERIEPNAASGRGASAGEAKAKVMIC